MRAANFFIFGVDILYYKQYNRDRKRKESKEVGEDEIVSW